MTARRSYLEFLIANGLAITLLSVFYFLWRMPTGLAAAVFTIANLVWLYRSRKVLADVLKRAIIIEKHERLGVGYAMAALCFDAVIIMFAVLVRTDESLVSPWEIMPAISFAIYAIAWLYAILAWRRLNPLHSWLLAVLQTASMLTLTAIIYKLGFGYDAFVHEATLSYIAAHGEILPKQPFYIGEYMSLLPWFETFKISVNNLQLWFLPIVSAILLPTSLKFFTKDGKPSYWILGLMLFAPLTFTVPFNFGVLLLAVTALLAAGDKKIDHIAAVILGIAALTVHPLVGVPTLVIASISLLKNRLKAWQIFSVTFILLCSGLLGALYYYNLSHSGQTLAPTFAALWDSTKILFRSPAEFSRERPWWSALYFVYAFWPHMLTVLGAIGLWNLKNKKTFGLLSGGALGLLVTAVIAASCFRYKDIIVSEQYEFSYRLISLLPWVMMGGIISSYVLRPRSYVGKVVYSIIIVVLLTMNWHVSYPQYNASMPYYAPSISRYEIETVDWIEDSIGEESYTALAPQFVAAAALRKFGFEKSISTPDGTQYPYPIPTGGKLYAIYLDLLSGRDMAESLDEARKYGGTDYVVVVIPESWDPYGVLQDYLSAAAEKKTVVGEMGVYIIH